MSLTRQRRPVSDGAEAAAGSSGSAAHDAAVAATAAGVPRRRPARQPAHTLLPLELAPAHVRDNPYILHGYRPTGGFRKSLSTLVRMPAAACCPSRQRPLCSILLLRSLADVPLPCPLIAVPPPQ